MQTEDHKRMLDILEAAAPTQFPAPAACRALGDQYLETWRATGDDTYGFGAEAAEMMAELRPMAEAGVDFAPVLEHVHRLLVLAR